MPAQKRPQVFQYGIYLLLTQAISYGIDKIPPATLIGIVAQALLYTGTIKVPWNARDVCISSKKVLWNRDWKSFILSNFEHASDMHLYYNMVSFMLKGSYLESMYGTANFALLLACVTVGCSAMYTLLGYVLMQLTGDYGHFIACAVGFSGVLFALKLIVICEEFDRPQNVGGFRVPSKISVWVELILMHLLVPNSSLTGHLGGILVGCLYCYTFVGRIIDNVIYTITGTPIIHEEPFYRRREWFVE